MRLVTADGAPAARADGRVMVLDALQDKHGPEAVPVYRVRTDLTGVVDIAFPVDDPYVVAHPGQRVFNVEARFTYALLGRASDVVVNFVYDRTARREITTVPVSGTVVSLPAPTLRDDPPSAVPCSDPPDSAAFVCIVKTYPMSMRAIPTVFATNIGAGLDSKLDVTYEQSGRIETTTIHEFGAGIFEGDGTVRTSNSNTITVGWHADGVKFGSANEVAVIHTAWVSIERQYCERPDYPFNGPINCRHDGTTWLPYTVTGNSSIDGTGVHKVWHDRYCSPYDPSDCPDGLHFPCIIEFSSDYNVGTGQETNREYGASVEFKGEIHGIGLHASSKYIKSETKGSVSAFKYHAVNPATVDHYLFTYTDLPYDQTLPGGGVCPETDIGDAWTTTTKPLVEPDPFGNAEQAGKNVDRAAEQNTSANPGAENAARGVGRCRYVPEDCRPAVAARTSA